MHIVVTGNGTSGSWKIRGEQLGNAIGAEVCPRAGKRDIADADLVVVVKRTPDAVLSHLRELGKPWIFDCVDFWPQPYGNDWGRLDSINWLRGALAHLKPIGIVFPTRQMQLEAKFSGPSIVLPHHARPGLAPSELREKVGAVVYEGAEHYLGRWRGLVEQECKRRGWRFLINPDSITQGDIGLALRDQTGWPATAWKSNVKLANIHAAGLPAICSRERGYEETANGTEQWVTDEGDLIQAFDAVYTLSTRREIREASCKIRLDSIAADYAVWLAGFSSCGAARQRIAAASA